MRAVAALHNIRPSCMVLSMRVPVASFHEVALVNDGRVESNAGTVEVGARDDTFVSDIDRVDDTPEE